MVEAVAFTLVYYATCDEIMVIYFVVGTSFFRTQYLGTQYQLVEANLSSESKKPIPPNATFRPGNEGLLRGYQRIMVVNSPFIRPFYFLGQNVALAG